MNLGHQTGQLVSLCILLTIAVPISANILFFETNIFKNISILRVIEIILLGGVLSLIAALSLDNILGNDGSLNFSGALLTGITEEVGKILIAAYFLKKLNSKTIFNGLLIGSAVGSGFAAFENIQYLFTSEAPNVQSLIGIVLYRNALSIADHTEWCAIAAAGLIIANSAHEFEWSSLVNGKFLRFLLVVIIIHALWDWNYLDSFGNIRYVVLIVIVWIIVLVLIHAGMREVRDLTIKTSVN